MKKIFFLILIIISSISIFPQYYRIGGVLNILVKNKNYDYQMGPSFVVDYTFEKIPISIAAITRMQIGGFSGQSEYYPGKNIIVYSFGATVNYYPIKWVVEPYIGAALFYNANQLGEGPTYANNISPEFTIGLKFSAMSNVNFICEITKTINKPEHEVEVYSPVTYQKTGEKRAIVYDLDSLFLRLGLMFRL
jgi:hypothetical protein